MPSRLPAPRHALSPVIVCPTPDGGHMDHSMDLALALQGLGMTPTILSRPGSNAYAPPYVRSRISIIEALPALPPSTYGRTRRLLALGAQLVLEHVRIRRYMAQLDGAAPMILQEPRYPFPPLLHKPTGGDTTLLLHNAAEHSQAGRNQLVARLRLLMKNQCARYVTRIITFGERQAATVRAYSSKPIKATQLPRGTRIQNDNALTPNEMGIVDVAANAFVCIGELRPNKGIETALQAADITSMPLLVIGRGVDPDYTASLQHLAAGVPSATLIDEFLSSAAFDAVISASKCVILPYTQFDAQSGVLARAADLGAYIIASDLPSIREQVAGIQFVSLVQPNTARQFAEAMNLAASQSRSKNYRAPEHNLEQWDHLAKLSVFGW